MAAFTIDMSSPLPSSPLPSGFKRRWGGPGEGHHLGEKWFNRFGMDLGATVGTEVHAAFEAKISVFHQHVPSSDSGREYGAQLFMRSPNDMMGGFYTHITGVPASLGVGVTVHRGDLLGTVITHDGIPAHLHMALVEIIGGLPGGKYKGVDNLYQKFLDTADKTIVFSVTFNQDGSPPTV